MQSNQLHLSPWIIIVIIIMGNRFEKGNKTTWLDPLECYIIVLYVFDHQVQRDWFFYGGKE